MALTSDQLLSVLPETFRYSEALERISGRQLRRLLDDGSITPIARGLYRKSDWVGDEDLLEISVKVPHAALCMRSALSEHGLIDDIPAEIDIAIPRGAWASQTTSPVRWRHFDRATFDVGRGRLDLGQGRSIGLYSAERSVIDAFRLRHLDGSDLAIEALKKWLRQGGQPSDLIQMARSFPRALTPLRETIAVLL